MQARNIAKHNQYKPPKSFNDFSLSDLFVKQNRYITWGNIAIPAL